MYIHPSIFPPPKGMNRYWWNFTVVVYDLGMCMKVDNPCPKISGEIIQVPGLSFVIWHPVLVCRSRLICVSFIGVLFLFQCCIDLWSVAQGYVFFEKLILKVRALKNFPTSMYWKVFNFIWFKEIFSYLMSNCSADNVPVDCILNNKSFTYLS